MYQTFQGPCSIPLFPILDYSSSTVYKPNSIINSYNFNSLNYRITKIKLNFIFHNFNVPKFVHLSATKS